MVEGNPGPEQADRASGQSSPSRASLLVAGGVLAAVVLWAGYVQHWRWTGINGQTATLWDWLHLLLPPLLVPTVVVPALRPIAMSGVRFVGDDEGPAEADVAASAAREASRERTGHR